MKYLFTMLIGLLLAAQPVLACDMCGGGSGSQYIGLLPGFKRNFVGVQHTASTYSGYFPSFRIDQTDAHNTLDHFNTIQLWARHKIARRYLLFAFVPYQYNVRYDNTVRSVNDGAGDMTLMVNRLFVDVEGGDVMHTLFGGVGVKLPTGKHSAAEISNIPSQEPGTGTWDFNGNVNYTIRKDHLGINVDASGTITTPAPNKYKYGNRLSAGVSGFYVLELKKWRLTPQAGIRVDHSAMDKYNYVRNWENTASGGQLLFATAGGQLTYKNVGLRVTAMLPVYQHYAGGIINANYKTETGFFVLF